MYIGSIDEDGLHHLLLEVVSNSIDEFLNGHGTEVTVEISKDAHTVTIFDDGRGVPFGKTKDGSEALIDVTTSLHAGGKFGQEAYSVSGGLHGIGLTAVNALSEQFTITSVRDGKKATLSSVRGREIVFGVVNAAKTDKQGTTVIFTPDKEVFGKATFKSRQNQKHNQRS